MSQEQSSYHRLGPKVQNLLLDFAEILDGTPLPDTLAWVTTFHSKMLRGILCGGIDQGDFGKEEIIDILIKSMKAHRYTCEELLKELCGEGEEF